MLQLAVLSLLLWGSDPVVTSPLVVSFETSTAAGVENRDSVFRALHRMGVVFDSVDRTAIGSNDIDYRYWRAVIWCTGDRDTVLNPRNSNLGVGALSAKDKEELTEFLDGGRTYLKRSLILAGQNLANHMVGNIAETKDTAFLQQRLHTRFVANFPAFGEYDSTIRGEQTYFKFSERITAASPDVIKRAEITLPVGSKVNGVAYHYQGHHPPSDSAAGVTWHGPNDNIVFYAFDWRDPKQSVPAEAGINTSGVTRVTRGALDFITSSSEMLPDWWKPLGVESKPRFITSWHPDGLDGSGTIRFALPAPSRGSFRLVDIAGRSVGTGLHNVSYGAGEYDVNLSSLDLSPGIYLYELTAEANDGPLCSSGKVTIGR